jgi:hypothetical protein
MYILRTNDLIKEIYLMMKKSQIENKVLVHENILGRYL